MLGAGLYLTACSFKNRILRRFRRLREPRYAVGVVVGALYFYFMVFRTNARHQVSAGSVLTSIAEPLRLIVAMLLLVVAAAAWVLPGLGRALQFSRAEVQFLFTAPVTRRSLVQYAVLRGLLSLLLSSAFTTVFLRPSSLVSAWSLIVGMWLVMLTIRLHLMAAALGRRSLAQHGTSGWLRQGIPLAIVMGAAAVIGVTLGNRWGALRALPNEHDLMAELTRLASTGMTGAVLWPFLALARLPLSASAVEFGRHLPAVVGLIVLNYLWVLRSDAAFEEASAEHAERGAAGNTAARPQPTSAGRPPFVLGATGLPETAILWKNLIQIGRYASARTLMRVIPLVIVLALVGRNAGAQSGAAAFVAGLCLPLLFVTVLLGPQMIRNDLRQDLGHLGLLKTWPVSGPAMVRGALLAPTAVLTAVAWILIAVATLLAGELTQRNPAMVPWMADRLSLAVAAAIVAPAAILVQILLHNGLAVIFPAWVAVGDTRARGLDVMGQRMVLFGGIALSLVVALIPPVLFGGALFLAGRLLLQRTFIIGPALVFAAVAVAECWVGAEVLGRVLDRTDVGAVEVSGD
jgi:ABC-2 type transport system permease protein